MAKAEITRTFAAALILGSVFGCAHPPSFDSSATRKIATAESSAPSEAALIQASEQVFPSLNARSNILSSRTALERYVFIKLIEAIRAQRALTPYRGQEGPRTVDYDLSKAPIGVVYNLKSKSGDLLLFNWPKGKSEGITEDSSLSQLLGEPVYSFKGLSREAIAHGQTNLWTSSTIFGAQSFRGDTDPFEKSISTKHVLRQGLGSETMPLLIPSMIAAYPDALLEATDPIQKSANAFLGMMTFLRETHRSRQTASGSTDKKYSSSGADSETLKSAVNRLKSSTRFTREALTLLQLGAAAVSAADGDKTAARALFTRVLALRSSYPEAWQVYSDDEFNEGFADFAAYQTAIDLGWITEKDAVDQILEDGSSLSHRTGALAGLYMVKNSIHVAWKHSPTQMPSAWEQILTTENVGTITEPQFRAYMKTLPVPVTDTITEENKRLVKSWSIDL